MHWREVALPTIRLTDDTKHIASRRWRNLADVWNMQPNLLNHTLRFAWAQLPESLVKTVDILGRQASGFPPAIRNRILGIGEFRIN